MANLLDNLDRLRLGQSYADVFDVEPILVEVPVRKPRKQEFIRVNPDEKYFLDTALLKDDKSGEFYIVDPAIQAALEGCNVTLQPTNLVLAINRQNGVFLWPLRLPGDGDRGNSWFTSATAAAVEAKDRWVRVAADMAEGRYSVYVAPDDLGEPNWPEQDFKALLNLAFQDRQIEGREHPIVRELEGRL